MMADCDSLLPDLFGQENNLHRRNLDSLATRAPVA